MGQLVQVDDPSGEYVPFGHVKHADELVAPAVLEYVPIGHGVHVDELVVLEYVPIGHVVQQVDPCDENVPVGQTKHADEFLTFEYVPAKHEVQDVPVLYVPGKQLIVILRIR